MHSKMSQELRGDLSSEHMNKLTEQLKQSISPGVYIRYMSDNLKSLINKTVTRSTLNVMICS